MGVGGDHTQMDFTTEKKGPMRDRSRTRNMSGETAVSMEDPEMGTTANVG